MGCGSSDSSGSVSQPQKEVPKQQPQQSGNKSSSDQKFEKAVNTIFDKYDKDKSGELDKAEVTEVINAALLEMEGGRKAKKEQIDELIKRSDTNKNGKINRSELINLFKQVVKN